MEWRPPTHPHIFFCFHSSSLPIIWSSFYIFRGTLRIFARRGSFILVAQVPQASNALSNTISENQPGCDGFVKASLLLRVDLQQMKRNGAHDGDRDTFSRYCLVRFSAFRHFSCVCLRPCLQMRKIGSEIWWIVSYMKTTGGLVIYGVNNGVCSQAWSPGVFLFVVRWQKYYSQTAHRL